MRKMAIPIFSLVLIAVAAPKALLCQRLSDVYLIEIELEGSGYIFGRPIKINSTEGYNNQPSFYPDGASVFYSSGTGSNTDIFQYSIETGKTLQLTDTPDSEYSPTVMPGGGNFSVIQLITSEGTRKGAQPLISFPLSGGEPKLVFEEGERVGYHAWISRHKVALFLLGSPNFLQIVDLKERSSTRVADNIGRSISKIPGLMAVSFSQIKEGDPDVIMMYSLDTGNAQSIVPMLKGNEFYSWTPSGSLLMGVGSRLFEFTPGEDEDWRQIGDLREFGIDNISRIAVDPKSKYLAVVNNRPEGETT